MVDELGEVSEEGAFNGLVEQLVWQAPQDRLEEVRRARLACQAVDHVADPANPGLPLEQPTHEPKARRRPIVASFAALPGDPEDTEALLVRPVGRRAVLI